MPRREVRQMRDQPGHLDTPEERRIAWIGHDGSGPTVVWLGGFNSDMTGTKAVALDAWAQRTGRSFVRFDYSGHGASSGRFEDGTVSQWLEDALAVIDASTKGPLVLVGSSMGGWISLLVSKARRERVRAMCLIAPAPDFTEDLMWAGFPAEVREQIVTEGVWLRPSAYGAPYPITRALIEDGRSRLVLRSAIPFGGPVRILHGQHDDEVPWQRSLQLAEALETADVRTTFVKSGDHRLSSPQEIALLLATVEELVA
jgi:pimeloyl-ACP methyl ester carboxylesterase